MMRAFSISPFSLAAILAAALLVLLLAAGNAHAQDDPPETERFGLPKGPIVRQVPPIDHIERPHHAAPDRTRTPEEQSEWQALWERNATPDAEEVERFRQRQRELDANTTNQTRERFQGSSGGYYREPFPEDRGVIRRRTFAPTLDGGTLHRDRLDVYEPYP